MATTNKKQFNLKIAIAIILIVLVIMILILIIVKSTNKNEQANIEKENAKYLAERDEQIKINLSEKPELERMSYYCASFFKLIDSKNYEEAYKLLYSDYRENFFPNFSNFRNYFEEYFPEDFSLSYQNMERLGDIYVLWVSVTDNLNGAKYGHNFNMYVVIKENALNDFVISFSRDSAVDEEE